MKTTKYFLLFLLLSFCSAAVFSAPSEADFIKLTKEYTFFADGSMEFHYSKQLKINSHLALNNLYGETFIVYNPEYQTLKFNHCYTRQADGTLINMPRNAFNEVLPSNAADAPAYNHLKEMVVTHTGLELGATIFLDYTLSTRPGYSPQPEVDEILQEASPVKEYTVIVNIPADKELSYTLTGTSVKPRISVKNNKKQYRWILKNIPAASREYFQPQDAQNAFRLTACYASSPQEILNRYFTYFHTDLNPDHLALVQKLLQDPTSEREKIFALQSFVVHRIANSPIPSELLAYKMRTPDEIIKSAYGTEAEKTQLLIALLKTLNYNPELVVVYPGSLNHSVKGLKSISSLKVKIDDKGQPLFLSALNELAEPIELKGNRHEIWLVSKNNARPLTVISSRGEIITRGKIHLSPSEAHSELTLNIKGLLPYTSEKNQEKWTKNFLQGFGKIQEKTISLVQPREAQCKFLTHQNFVSHQGYSVYTLPTSAQGIQSWRMKLLNSKRNTLLELPYPIKESYEYELILDPSVSLKTVNKEIHKNTAVGRLDIMIRQNENKIQVIKNIEIDKSLITPAEYSNFRDLMITWFSQANENIILH